MATDSSTSGVLMDPVSQPALVAMAKSVMHDRAVGTIMGSALGDAVGLYTEFLRKDRVAAEYPNPTFSLLPNATPFARDHHRMAHRLGEWTDDTDHAILILLSFLHSQQLDPNDVARRLHTWVRMGLRALDTVPLGLGATVGTIVRNPKYLDNPAAAAHAHWVKTKHGAAPNGSLMRTHPLGIICVHRSLEETFTVAARFSAITHVDPRCVVSCMIGAALIRGLIRSEVSTEQHVDELIDVAIKDYSERIRPMFIYEGTLTESDPNIDAAEVLIHTNVTNLEALELDGSGIGYVLKCLGSGISVLRTAMKYINSPTAPPASPGSPAPSILGHSVEARLMLFEPLITHLVRLGGDADTNACFAGALLGAYVGYSGLPTGWREGLLHGTWLSGKAEALCIVLGLRPGTYDGKNDKDTLPDGGRGFLTDDQMERRWMELQARMAAENTAFIRAEEAAAKKRTKADALWRLINWN